MPCEVLECLAKPLITRLMSALSKTEDGCIVIALNSLTLDSCNAAECGDVNSAEGVLQKVTLNDKVNVVEISSPYSEIVDCNYRSLDELFARALSKTPDNCFVLNISTGISDPGCESDCNSILPIEEKLMRSFMKDANGCVVLLVAENTDDAEALECNEIEAEETLLHKLLVPLGAPYEGHYAIRGNVNTVVAATCFGWNYTITGSDHGTLDSIGTGLQDFQMNVDLSQSEAQIVAGIKAALDSPSPPGPPMTYTEVYVTKTPNGSDFDYTFIIKDPNPVPTTMDIDGNTDLINEMDCP